MIDIEVAGNLGHLVLANREDCVQISGGLKECLSH